MPKRSTLALALLALAVGLLPAADSQVPSGTRSLYQITSGTYTMVGGIWGSLSANLPNPDQTCVLLTTDPQNGRAELTFLGQDQQTPFLTLTNGLISGTVIRFQYPARHPYPDVGLPGMLDYTVTNLAGTLRIDGNII